MWRLVTYLTILLACFSLNTKGQNLVRNGSFEDTITSNQQANYINGLEEIVPPWFSSLYTPDFFSPGGFANGRCIPTNSYGFQYPQDGVCYGGFSAYAYNTDNYNQNSRNFREWIGQKLESPLKKNVIYNYEFYVSKPERTNFSTTEIGFYFSRDSINMGQTYPDNGYPLVDNFFPYPDSAMYLSTTVQNEYLSDTINWVKVSGQYLAKGGEKFIYLGHFKPDNVIDLVFYVVPTQTTSNNYCYYYIDNISLIETGALNINENYSNEIQLYPNPAQDYFVVDIGMFTNVEVELFDISGRRLLQQNITANQEQVDVSGLANGVYIAVVSSGGQVVKREKVVVSR